MQTASSNPSSPPTRIESTGGPETRTMEALIDTEPAMASTVDDLDSQMDGMLASLLSGVPLKDSTGISSEMMEALYAQAYQLYRSNRLDEAENFFRLLCIYDFHNVDYVLGLGAVLQLKKNYMKAIEIYAAAYIIGNKELRPIFYAGQCGLLMDDPKRAKQCFELVIEESEDSALKSTARSYLAALAANTPLTRQGESPNEAD